MMIFIKKRWHLGEGLPILLSGVTYQYFFMFWRPTHPRVLTQMKSQRFLNIKQPGLLENDFMVLCFYSVIESPGLGCWIQCDTAQSKGSVGCRNPCWPSLSLQDVSAHGLFSPVQTWQEALWHVEKHVNCLRAVDNWEPKSNHLH